LVLFILEPNILAHGLIVHADVIAALAFLFFSYVLVSYWRNQNAKWALLLGAATGFALIAKFTLTPLAIVFVIALVARWDRTRTLLGPQVLAKAGALLLCLFIVNAAYFFRGTGMLLPPDFVEGFSRLARINQPGHDAYLLGKYSVTGWWYYFPITFLLKTTIPFLLLTFAAAVWAIVTLFANGSW